MKIQIEEISKTFKELTVVDQLSFNVEPGRIVGLLGPNGAGKTTTIRMILDILRPDSGRITFDGQLINRETRNHIGYLPEERGLYQKYRVMDVIWYFGRLKNLPKRKSHIEAVRLLDTFKMIDYVEEPIGHLSKGMQQKLQFLVCLIHNPDILIMDEPMASLDPINQKVVREKINQLRDEGKTILLSTHQLPEAENLCDYFVLIDHGKVVLQGTLAQIQKSFNQNMIVLETKQDPALLKGITGIRKIEMRDSALYLSLDKNAQIKEIMQRIVQKVDISRLEIYKPSLHDIFMQIIKGGSK
jgi:ABC-2 type transport system ATP-binding protein